MLALPGGFVDQWETPEEAVIRELREETGLAGEVTGLAGIYPSIHRDEERHTIAFVYEVRLTSGGDGEAGDDAAGLEWLPLDALPPLAFDHTAILNDFRAGYRLVRARTS